MQPNEIIEVLNRPISQELLARDVTRSHIGMSTTKNAPKLPWPPSRTGS
ncbi:MULTISPECIES: hypothetical protein [Streptomyces]|uniref:Uncharacterized protein n=2 Tax=Streptomyces avermitilis TaxID=33903 RepID=Q82QN0_STRAW|nr:MULTISPECIES: hypothetical protein [Streptomyces]BAC68185.1 hypothetical protein SAVERM_475 [Streptomyces avermitilis MA-4680 = NBRC 14893]GDY69648.1 hypothetical protein SAV14893_090410 [Streptomyces avermitilis]GDY79902.1 hypothetical protein SAV31267_093870 [Streptomyces avermitilis]